jgi:hypothetical protein
MGSQEGQYYQLEPIVSDNIPNKSEFYDSTLQKTFLNT